MPKVKVTYDTIRRLALALPNVEEGTSYGTPALKVKGKLFVRLHDDRDKIVLKMPFDRREEMMAEDPETIFRHRPLSKLSVGTGQFGEGACGRAAGSAEYCVSRGFTHKEASRMICGLANLVRETNS